MLISIHKVVIYNNLSMCETVYKKGVFGLKEKCKGFCMKLLSNEYFKKLAEIKSLSENHE
jgi:hypothetical protein